FFFASRSRHSRSKRDWSSDVCSSDLANLVRSGKVTSRDLVDMAYSIIEKTNPDLNNIVALTKEQAYKKLENLEDTGQPFYGVPLDRKSTRLNSSHVSISYAVFCLKKN